MGNMENKSVCELAEKGLLCDPKTENSDKKLYVDKCRIMLVETENESIKSIMSAYKDTEAGNEFKNSIKEITWNTKVKVPASYLKVLLEFLKKNKDIDSVTLHASDDYPICFELEDIKTRLIIAPRVED